MLAISRTTLVILAASIFTSGSQITLAQDSDESINGNITLPYPADSVVSLGMGWNLQTNEAVTNICIQSFETYDVENNQRIEELTQGNNSFSLSQSLDISASQTVSVAAGYAGVSGHASMTSQMGMAQNFDETTDNRYILAKQHIVTKWSAIKSSSPGEIIDLSSAAKALISSSTSDSKSDANFYEQCGHGYVAQIEYGGSFYGLFNMHTTSYTNSESFKSDFQQAAGISYSGVTGSASASESSTTSSEQNLNKSISQNKVSITVLEAGGTASAAGTDMSSVLTQYKNFPLSLNAVDGGESPATEFRMVIVPYPNMPPLTQFDAQLLSIAREYGKWKYLATTIGKIISSEHNGDSQYTFINGVTLSPSGLEAMQNMAQAKIDRISVVAGQCMDRIRGKNQSSTTSTTDPCSLEAKNPDDFTKSGTNKVAWIKSPTETVYVPVAESDITYLVRLPFESSIYDAMSQAKPGDVGATKYSDVIFNQVIGIYKERCPKIQVARFCENAAKTEQAIATYVAPASGSVYQKIQSLAGTGGLCLSAMPGGKVQTVNCQDTDKTDTDNDMYWYIDKDSKLVRSLTGVCLYTARIRTSQQYLKPGHHTPEYRNLWTAEYQWQVCPDRYDGSTPPTIKQTYFSDLVPLPVATPNPTNAFVFQDAALKSGVYGLNASNTSTFDAGAAVLVCPVLKKNEEKTTPVNGSCALTGNPGAQFSRTDPRFVTAKAESLGIINAFINTADVVVTPTVANYFKAGVNGVTSDNLDKINKGVTTLYTKGTPATVKQINTYVAGS